MPLLVRVGKRLPAEPLDARRQRLEQALAPRPSDHGCLSVYHAADVPEAEQLAVLHFASTHDSPEHVDLIIIDELGLTTPPTKHEHGLVPRLRAAHYELRAMDDAAVRSAVVDRLLAEGAVQSLRVRKADAIKLLSQLLEADPSLEPHISPAWHQ